MVLHPPVRSRVYRATLAAVCASAVAALVITAFSYRNAPTRRFPAERESLLEPFGSGMPTSGAYEGLFRYFLNGFLTYRAPHGQAAYYPGLPSNHGARVDAMEGFTRFAPLAAAWLHSGRPARIQVAEGPAVDLPALIRDGILVGTDPGSPGYWGPIKDRDQRTVEAADVALTLWLTRDSVWKHFSPSEKGRIQRWLTDGLAREVSDNNWHLFPTFVSLVMRELGQPVDLAPALQHYARFKTFYRGDGWFSDGPGKVYDYYNAWAIHYQLYWIDQVSPTWDPHFIRSSRREFLESYKQLMGPSGVPIRGRSICYRMAAPAPLVFDYASSSSSTKAGEARRALDLTWTYFIRRGAVRAGTITQGYCGADKRLLDNYSGPASCLWSLRSLIPAFAIPAGDAFWQGARGSLPIDRGNYRARIASIGWTIVGDAAAGTTALTADDSLPDSLTDVQSAPSWLQLKSLVTGRPYRPLNTEAKYQRGTYQSEPPFCGCK
jgi:hypothetical protein